MHREMIQDVKKIYFPPDDIRREYERAVQSGDEEAQERILRQVWEEKQS